jgi:hypothetical protein
LNIKFCPEVQDIEKLFLYLSIEKNNEQMAVNSAYINNLSVLPWYTSLEQQNARKWWMYGKVYPLFTPAMFMLPFQIIREHDDSHGTITSFKLYKATGEEVVDLTSRMNGFMTIKRFTDYDIWIYPGRFPLFSRLDNGQYYAKISDGVNTWYSEIFTAVNDIQPYLKIEWWDVEDFVMDAGTIVYTEPLFHNILYLIADIAKPEYPFEEEGEIRDGYFFPVKQISEKRYRFHFLASEYLLDAMRFIRMSDYVQITYKGQAYKPDTFLLTPNWEDNGDIAAVEAEFDTATVAKKIGRGYTIPSGGDFNDDYSDDFDKTENS